MTKDSFYTAEELAEVLRIKPNTIHSERWPLKSILKPIKVGKRLLFPKAIVEKLCRG